MSSNPMNTLTAITMQEDAMLAEYYAQQEEVCSSIDYLPESERAAALDFLNGVSRDADSSDLFFVDVSCRSDITLSGPSRIYPTRKSGQTSKRRRYVKPKKSDSDKIHGNP